MRFLRGTNALSAALVNHTGTMLRFTSSQLGHLPPADLDYDIELPDGQVVRGHFKRNPDNPYVGGASLVRWIKSWVGYNEPTPVQVRQAPRRELLAVSFSGQGAPRARRETKARFERAARRLNLPGTRQARRATYARWERSQAVRRFALQVWGPSCQVRGCRALLGVPGHLRDRMVDVHHLNHISTGGVDGPLNVAVLCVIHHQLIHRAPTSSIADMTERTVTVTVNGEHLELERDLRLIWT